MGPSNAFKTFVAVLPVMGILLLGNCGSDSVDRDSANTILGTWQVVVGETMKLRDDLSDKNKMPHFSGKEREEAIDFYRTLVVKISSDHIDYINAKNEKKSVPYRINAKTADTLTVGLTGEKNRETAIIRIVSDKNIIVPYDDEELYLIKMQ